MALKLSDLVASFGGSLIFLYTLLVKVYSNRQENQISVTAFPQLLNNSFLLLQSYGTNGNQKQSNDRALDTGFLI